MRDLDEAALKTEIDQISKKIDAIMKRVDRLYPPQPKPAAQEHSASEDKPPTSPDPSG
jgi:hypothetical protein